MGDDTPPSQKPSAMLESLPQSRAPMVALQHHARLQWINMCSFMMLWRETEDWDKLVAAVQQRDIGDFVRLNAHKYINRRVKVIIL